MSIFKKTISVISPIIIIVSFLFVMSQLKFQKVLTPEEKATIEEYNDYLDSITTTQKDIAE